MSRNAAGRIRLASVFVIVVSVLLLMRALPLGPLKDVLTQWVRGLGPWGAVVFGAVYVAATVCMIPGSVLTLAAGAVFGLWVGFGVVSAASVTGASLAFLIARYLARKKVERMASGNAKFQAIDNAIGEGGWKIVAMLRLSPAIPFNLQNYLYGLTNVGFGPYVLTSWIAMMPGTFMYVYLGHAAGAAATGDGGKSVGQWALLGVGLAATVAVTVYITRLAKKQLDKRTRIREETQATETKETPTGAESGSGPWGYVAAATVMLAVAIAAQTQKELLARTITGWFGPPPVDSKETYKANPNGPRFDHSPFDDVLKAHVLSGGWVDYESLKTSPEQLNSYIETLAEAPFDDLDRNEKLALLINAYNAFTLKLIIERHPIASIKDIPAPERWDDARWTVGGRTWSLSRIEHEQIRPHFAEPRIHFALVCAAVGCPPLTNEAYTAARLEEQLERQTTYVHDHATWYEFRPEENTVHRTQLYDWYRGDFTQAAGSVLKYIAAYSPELRSALETKIPQEMPLEYDWALNGIENKQAR